MSDCPLEDTRHLQVVLGHLTATDQGLLGDDDLIADRRHFVVFEHRRHAAVVLLELTGLGVERYVHRHRKPVDLDLGHELAGAVRLPLTLGLERNCHFGHSIHEYEKNTLVVVDSKIIII